ncbi:MAG: hypothetical protein QOC77_462 [Thermoleophilaceae bacterium]|jgi:hypothetical protein|nr:hypothetical protein [Thermoleophilaceae bacterium]
MTFKRALVIALSAAAALPASAAAQAQITPTDGDNYLQPLALSDFQNPAPFPRQEIAWVADTTNYTVQSDMFNPPGSGGPAEPHNCGSDYGKTIWSVLHIDHMGTLEITTSAQFDSVIGFVPFNSPSNPAPDIANGVCIDRLAGLDEQLKVNVAANHWYAVQVGGTGSTQGGQVQTKFLFKPTNPPKPKPVKGQGFLFYKFPPLRITQMYATSVAKGSTIRVHCSKSCGNKTIKVRSKLMVDNVFATGPHMTPAALRAAPTGGASRAKPSATHSRAIVREAKARVSIFKNKRVASGTKVEMRITHPGNIGTYLAWKVPGGPPTFRCMKPGSLKPRKKCT